MRPADCEPAWRAILDGGWGDRRAFLTFALNLSAAQPFVAEAADGAIVGTAMTLSNGQTGWIGLIFVSPRERGHGLGARLTRTALEALRERGCRSILLAASELGLPIYRRLQFVQDGGYVQLVRPAAGLAVPELSSDIRLLASDDLDAVCALDRAATAEDRRTMLQPLTRPPNHAWVIGRPGQVRGYALLTPWGRGPLVASTPTHGQRLLDQILSLPAHDGELSITVPTENQLARDYLGRLGFEEQRQLPRMVLGAPVAWRPQFIWGIFNFAAG
jgi:ribosomal protein S18 acetylase RimI-like enzyme